MVVSEKLEEGDQLPPAYTDSAASIPPPPPIDAPCASSAASSSTPRPPLSPSTNFLTIVREHQAVKGGYTIDPSLPVPPGAVPSVGEDGKTLNMHVRTTHGPINVVIELVHGGDVKGPARLEVGSCYGSATVAVVSHKSLPHYFTRIDNSNYPPVSTTKDMTAFTSKQLPSTAPS